MQKFQVGCYETVKDRSISNALPSQSPKTSMVISEFESSTFLLLFNHQKTKVLGAFHKLPQPLVDLTTSRDKLFRPETLYQSRLGILDSSDSPSPECPQI
jgi:hypothetical protein